MSAVARYRLEHALNRVMDCRRAEDVAAAVCQGTAQIVDAAVVSLLEYRDGTTSELACFRRDFPQERGGVEQRRLERRDPASPTEIQVQSYEHSQMVLRIWPVVGAREREAAALMLDVAVATAQRIASDAGVRAHRHRLQQLRAAVGDLYAQDLLTQTPPTDAALDFAAAAVLLTEREREILRLLLRGESNAQIADALTVSIETVKSHVRSVLHKMGAANRAELIGRSHE